MWLHRFCDPRAYFWDTLNPDSAKQRPEDNWLTEYQMTRLQLYQRIPNHPSNLMFLRPTVHQEFFDNFRMTINPFTLRKFLCHLPGPEWMTSSWYKPQFDHALKAPFSDSRKKAYLAPPEDAYAAAYPSKLALLVHFRSALRYHCSWDLRATDQGMPANSPVYVPPPNAFTLVSSQSQPAIHDRRGRGRGGRGRRGLSFRRGG